MNKIADYVQTQMLESERVAIIADYDEWANTGKIGDTILREHAHLMAYDIYGDNAKYGPITTNMKELYIAVCRYFADKYLQEY